MEKSGKILTTVNYTFTNLNEANTDEKMKAIAKEIAPLYSKNKHDIRLNEKLFAKIKTVYNNFETNSLTDEQKRLVKKYYKDFVRGGANLAAEKKARFREINGKLSLLTLKFGENVLSEDNAFEMVLDSKEDLAGLPENVINSAAKAAKERSHEGKWVFTLHKPSLIPFLQYSEKRELREKMFKGYVMRGDNNNEFDNKSILSEISALRIERANLLGYKTHAHFVLDDNMAANPENVYKLLNKIWKPALAKAKIEARDLQDMIKKDGKKFELQAWDWWYYAEKLKKEKYAVDEEMLRPYFKMENVRQGAFDTASKLWGITFTEIKDIPKYHPEVEAFEVKEGSGNHIGVLYTDFFPRASKGGGAWMEAFRKQSSLEGKAVSPIIYNVGNFSRPSGDKPALLSYDEVQTLFHEFGHALHGLLSKGTYPSLTGTSVARDFVELPSQIMENWASEPQVLKMYAKHYETGEPIPDELIEKVEKSAKFNQGFVVTEFLSAAFLDMDWHTLTEPAKMDVNEFETTALNKIGLIPEIVVRYRSTYFKHIFSGEYSSGYYSYSWAEVLDADAFQAFKETDIFDQKTAQSFRENVLAAGNSEDPMVLYKRFRGKEPSAEALLTRKGLK
jgi:peptidyl-dipeptidase Dcp